MECNNIDKQVRLRKTIYESNGKNSMQTDIGCLEERHT